MFAVVNQFAAPQPTVTTTTTSSKTAGSTTVTITYPPYSTMVATPLIAPSLPVFASTPVYAYPSPIAAQPAYPYAFPVTAAPGVGVYQY